MKITIFRNIRYIVYLHSFLLNFNLNRKCLNLEIKIYAGKDGIMRMGLFWCAKRRYPKNIRILLILEFRIKRMQQHINEYGTHLLFYQFSNAIKKRGFKASFQLLSLGIKLASKIDYSLNGIYLSRATWKNLMAIYDLFWLQMS